MIEIKNILTWADVKYYEQSLQQQLLVDCELAKKSIKNLAYATLRNFYQVHVI
jgi:hypothetical protein